MAKKGKEFDEEDEDIEEEYEEDEKKSSKKGCLVTVIIFVIIIAILVAILGFNAGGIRDRYLRTTLEKIPIVRNLLPPLNEENLNTSEIQGENISAEQQTIDALKAEIQNLNAEINRLKAFEESQVQFKTEKEEFDRLIALNDAKAYSAFYESIAPENAERLYQEAVQKANIDKQFKDYISTFENMKKDAASKILEELIMTDMDLVITILENLSSTKRSEILSTMDAKHAASCAKLLSPQQY